MNDMAGIGRITITYGVCVELEQSGRLGVRFFCSVSSKCQDVNRILPTIVYQLAQQFYPFRSVLCRILGEGSNIGQRNISVQFEYLIKNPLLEVKDMLTNGLMLVLDALGECLDPGTTEMILDTPFRHATQLPILFFLPSRPEPIIANSIITRDSKSRLILHLHNVDEQSVKTYKTFLTVTLARLGSESRNSQSKRESCLFTLPLK
jgi:hypothetical protein